MSVTVSKARADRSPPPLEVFPEISRSQKQKNEGLANRGIGSLGPIPWIVTLAFQGAVLQRLRLVQVILNFGRRLRQHVLQLGIRRRALLLLQFVENLLVPIDLFIDELLVPIGALGLRRQILHFAARVLLQI